MFQISFHFKAANNSCLFGLAVSFLSIQYSQLLPLKAVKIIPFLPPLYPTANAFFYYFTHIHAPLNFLINPQLVTRSNYLLSFFPLFHCKQCSSFFPRLNTPVCSGLNLESFSKQAAISYPELEVPSKERLQNQHDQVSWG